MLDLLFHLKSNILLYPSGVPTAGFQVDAVDQVVLNLQDEVQQTWLPGDRIVVASTDYSMHQAEEFTLLPCPHCNSRQVKIQGERERERRPLVSSAVSVFALKGYFLVFGSYCHKQYK